MAIPLTDLQALEALLIDDPDLARLETLLDEFNIFEAIGMVRQELRHSDFLAFLLNPQQTHGLGDTIAKRLLQHVLRGNDAGSYGVTPLDFDLWELDALEVHREWRSIDILMLDSTHQFATILENKVGSVEHSHQLDRYWKTVQEHFPGWKILGIFLTPDGDLPSDERYIPLSYKAIHDLLTSLAEFRGSSMGPDIRTLLHHYTQMLQRNIMSESEIADLCRRIYRKHQRALDLIYEHRPDYQGQMAEFLKALVEDDPNLILDSAAKSFVRFLPKSWDYPALKQGGGWTPSRRMLLFELDNRSTQLSLNLYIGPGPQAIRQKLLDMALLSPNLQPASKTPNKMWNKIYGRFLLRPPDFADRSLEELKQLVGTKWEDFRHNTLPKLEPELLINEEQSGGVISSH